MHGLLLQNLQCCFLENFGNFCEEYSVCKNCKMGPHFSDFTQKRYFTQKRFVTQKAFNLQSAKQDLIDGRSVTESNIF